MSFAGPDAPAGLHRFFANGATRLGEPQTGMRQIRNEQDIRGFVRTTLQVAD